MAAALPSIRGVEVTQLTQEFPASHKVLTRAAQEAGCSPKELLQRCRDIVGRSKVPTLEQSLLEKKREWIELKEQVEYQAAGNAISALRETFSEKRKEFISQRDSLDLVAIIPDLEGAPEDVLAGHRELIRQKPKLKNLFDDIVHWKVRVEKFKSRSHELALGFNANGKRLTFQDLQIFEELNGVATQQLDAEFSVNSAERVFIEKLSQAVVRAARVGQAAAPQQGAAPAAAREEAPPLQLGSWIGEQR
jgi:hypothetical protein